ncbi:DUF309 domain-containing protein [Halorubrum sp. AD140]|uniref:DUF309 domain-containing protein n=1 Tax=Halorubrum sp. AD140 TaxID=3050073 RepID=UPI002ACCE26A|nr:DUF309 domain-containing protein [Halorubrum sp. AD140]MDZ5811359.1 DUF309 domain-containing protein [Halorubrum sp. AD140]
MTEREPTAGDDVDAATAPGDPPSVSAALAAGAALFNEGHVLAAHELWEAAWLPLVDGPDERLLHGLIAAAAATHHATERNWSGAVGCAANAVTYLGELADAARGVDVARVREWCRRVAADPEVVERASPPAVRIDGSAPRFDDLDLAAALLAATALADAVESGDSRTFEAAATLAREERGTGRTRFAELIFAFLRRPDARPQVAARLADHVERERRKRSDVEDLF